MVEAWIILFGRMAMLLLFFTNKQKDWPYELILN